MCLNFEEAKSVTCYIQNYMIADLTYICYESGQLLECYRQDEYDALSMVSCCYSRYGGRTGRKAGGATRAATPFSEVPTAREKLASWPERYV